MLFSIEKAPAVSGCQFSYYAVLRIERRTRLNKNTKMIAPSNAGIIAIPANEGPNEPRSSPPIHAPIIPAMMFPIMPPGTFFPKIIPASQPIKPPTIKYKIMPIFIHPFSVVLCIAVSIRCYSPAFSKRNILFKNSFQGPSLGILASDLSFM